mgnify:CR=1 FL=1
MSKSKASSEQFWIHYFLLIGFIFDSKSSIYLPKSVFKALMSDSEGGPVQVKTL